jgi:hypothetical protein
LHRKIWRMQGWPKPSRSSKGWGMCKTELLPSKKMTENIFT